MRKCEDCGEPTKTKYFVYDPGERRVIAVCEACHKKREKR